MKGRKDPSVGTKVGMAHVRVLDSANHAKGDAAELIRS
jgi:hypothetical protein